MQNFLVDNQKLDQWLFTRLGVFNHYVLSASFSLELMYITGCRASEALDFSKWLLLGNGNVALDPLKGNNKRIIDLGFFYQKFEEKWLVGESFFGGLTYRQLNYYTDKFFGNQKFWNLSKSLECHLFRHNYAKRLVRMGLSDIEVKDKMGERNQSSADQYIYSNIYSYTEIIL